MPHMTPKTKAFIDEWGIWIYRVALVIVGLLLVHALLEIADAIHPSRLTGSGVYLE